MKEASWNAACNSIKIEKNEIERLGGYLDKKSFSEAVSALASCGKIITCASGSSGIAAKKFAHSLCCIERDAIFLLPSEAIHGGLGCVKEGDAVIVVSRGGKTAELLPIVDVCKKKKAILITVTEKPEAILAAGSDITLRISLEKESDPLNVMATSSYVVTIALFDALLAALIIETGYSLDMFALIHPGGAVGERLNTKEVSI